MGRVYKKGGDVQRKYIEPPSPRIEMLFAHQLLYIIGVCRKITLQIY